MHQRLRGAGTIAAGILLISLGGCGGGDDGPELGEVEGKVTLDGTPLKGAAVSIIPDQGRPSRGQTDADGRFVMKYTRDKPGVVVGTHPVRVDLPLPELPNENEMSAEAYNRAVRAAAQKAVVPEEWRNGSQKVTVEAGSQEFNIDMVSEQRQ